MKPKVIILGSGQVAVALLELMSLQDKWTPSVLVIAPREPVQVDFKRFRRSFQRIDPLDGVNYERILDGAGIMAGDIMVDLTVDVCSISLIRWCRAHDVHFLNTALEKWPGSNNQITKANMYERSLQSRHVDLEQILSRTDFDSDVNFKSTFIVTMGMNPGLISAFAKKALRVMHKDLYGTDPSTTHAGFARMAQRLGVKVIQCTERDTQTVSDADQRGAHEFLNTWSIPGLLNEGLMDLQIGWGTHERAHSMVGSQRLVHRQAVSEWLHSYVPLPCDFSHAKSLEVKDGLIRGLNIPHSENFTLSRFLSLPDNEYRPSAYYVYQPTKSTLASLEYARGLDDPMKALEHTRDMNALNIVKGYDAVGALLVRGGWRRCFWAGTLLDIEETRRLGFKVSGPTTVQVAAGLWSAMRWLMRGDRPERRARGLLYPEDLDEDEILAVARPWLGEVRMKWVPFRVHDARYEAFRCRARHAA